VVLEAPAPPPGSRPRPESTPPASNPPRRVADASPMADPEVDNPSTRVKTTRVVSANVNVRQRLAEIWRSRELLVYLVRTEIKVKYKNSVLGLLWSMLSPSMTLVVYTLVFGVLLKSEVPNFVIFLFSGLLIWNFFQYGVMTATGVVVNNAGLVKKVSFPREILALAAMGSAAVFFFFQALVMAVFMIALHMSPAWPLIWLLLVALVPMIVFASALGIFLAAVNVYMRDTQHLVEVLVGAAWFWACPIVYSFKLQVASHLQGVDHWRNWLYFANPMTPLVMTFQRVLYNRPGLQSLNHPIHTAPVFGRLLPTWSTLDYVRDDLYVLVASLVLFYIAMVIFGRLAGNFAEEL